MKKFYEVKVMNRFENDRITRVKYFSAAEKANAYAIKVNDEYNTREALGDFGRMVYHVDLDWGIVEHEMDEEEA